MFRLVLIAIALMTTSCSDASSNCSKEETLKLIGAGYTKAEISGLCTQTEKQESTDTKSSAVEGKLVDRNGVPVANVKITASQQQPIKGYEQFEAETDADGFFRIEGLYPSSRYALKPWTDKWIGESAEVESAPQDEIAVLPSPLVIKQAFSKESGALVTDLATGATRFIVSDDGVISDSQTDLDWLVGPDKETVVESAEQWFASVSDVAGGGWRMPTGDELKTLYQKGVGGRNIDPAFRMTGWYVWAKGYGIFTIQDFNFKRGYSNLSSSLYKTDYRVFGVRARPSQSQTSTKSKPSSSQATNVSKDKNRFSEDKTTGIITDSKTGLDWLAGPVQGTNYQEAEQFIATISDLDGGGWRMPTRQDLKSLHQNGAGKRTSHKGLRDDVFPLSGQVWAGPLDSSEQIDSLWAWYMLIYSNGSNEEAKALRDKSYGFGVFAVRSRPSQSQTSTKSQPPTSQATDLDNAKGAKRFSKDKTTGAIIDSKTRLEWMIGPDKDTNYYEAEKWVTSLGESWRMPTCDDLANLVILNGVKLPVDPVFHVAYLRIWCESTRKIANNKKLVIYLDAPAGSVTSQSESRTLRAFAVRAHRQS